MFIDLDAEFHVPKLLFEDFLPKIIRGAANCESLILRVKFLCLKYGGTHGIKPYVQSTSSTPCRQIKHRLIMLFFSENVKYHVGVGNQKGNSLYLKNKMNQEVYHANLM